MDPVLVTMNGPRGLQVSNLSNFEAGIAFLTLVDRLSPGITFGELVRSMEVSEYMAGWWTDLKKATSSVKDGIGDVLKSTMETVGSAAGSSVRLVTDEKVIDGASRLGTAWATGGGSEGVRSVLGGGNMADQLIGFISSLGDSFKAKSAPIEQASMGGGMNAAMLPWLIGGGALLVLLVGRRR